MGGEQDRVGLARREVPQMSVLECLEVFAFSWSSSVPLGPGRKTQVVLEEKLKKLEGGV